jgi:hypothetical protein
MQVTVIEMAGAVFRVSKVMAVSVSAAGPNGSASHQSRATVPASSRNLTGGRGREYHSASATRSEPGIQPFMRYQESRLRNKMPPTTSTTAV